MKNKYLDVTSVEGRTDRNGKPFNLVGFSTSPIHREVDEITGEIIEARVQPKTTRKTFYPESYLPDGTPEYGHDFKVGEKVAGDLVRLETLPYEIVNQETGMTNTATTATILVLGLSSEGDWNETVVECSGDGWSCKIQIRSRRL